MITGKKNSALQYRANRQTKGSWSPRSGSTKMKDLLAEDAVETTETAKVISKEQTSKDTQLDFSRFPLKTSRYEHPRIGRVPATYYHSKIVGMSIREKNDKVILDVKYDLVDCYGRVYYIVQSYPADSQPYRRFAEALEAAGVSCDANADAGIGVEEIIELDYVSKSSDLGSIVNRRPYTTPSADDENEDENEAEDYDDEFDDFLETEED